MSIILRSSGRLSLVSHNSRLGVRYQSVFFFFEARLFNFSLFLVCRRSGCPVAYKSQFRPCFFLSSVSLLENSLFALRQLPAFLFLQFFFYSYTMPKDGNDSDGLGEAHLALWESKLSRADEHRVRSECFLPKFVKIRFDEEKSGAVVHSNCNEVCVYEIMFRAGFRLPFLPVV